jgi:hypothetical protein
MKPAKKWTARFGNPRVDVTATFEIEATSERQAKAKANKLRETYRIPQRLTLLKQIGEAAP